MRKLKTYQCKNPYYYYGFGTADLIKVSIQRHEPRESVRFALIDRMKKKVKYITSCAPKAKMFSLTRNPSRVSPYSWWMILNLLGYKIMITCD